MGHPIACGKPYCSEQRWLFHSLGEEIFSVAFHLSNNFVSDTVCHKIGIRSLESGIQISAEAGRRITLLLYSDEKYEIHGHKSSFALI